MALAGARAIRRWRCSRRCCCSSGTSFPIRANVERVFGPLKRSYGYRRVRYRGLERNRSHLHLLCIAINLRRAEVLTR